MAPRPAKITRPLASAAVERPRLWARLDEATRDGGVLWIAGPPGSGKTTVLASWLGARRRPAAWLRLDPADAELATFLHYLAAAVQACGRRRVRLPALEPGLDADVFARRFFRALLPSLPARAVLVLDDVGAVPAEAPLLRALVILLEELPAGVTALLASRGEPPPGLLPGGPARAPAVVAARELELTVDEALALARRHGFTGGRRRAAELRRAVHGWAVGLVLLLANDGGQGGAGAEAATVDYFAGEVLERVDARTRRVLLETALLDAPTGSLAALATGERAAPRILAGLARRGLFTLAHGGDDPAFELHALFRAFLLRRGREELPPGRAAEVRRAAAAALAARGGADAEAAFALLAEAGAFEEAAAVAARAAPALLAGGRAATLEAWLARLPPDHREADPWLLHFGAVARLGREPEAAIERLDRATAAFAARGEAAGVWRSWAAAVEAIVVAGRDFTPLGRRIYELEGLRARFPVPTPELEARLVLAKLSALVHHAPGHPALRDAVAAARALALSPGDDRLRLAAGAGYTLYTGWWLGDVDALRPVWEALGPIARAPGADGLAAIFWLAVEAPTHLLAGDEAAAARTAGEARALAARLGVRSWDAALLTQAIWGALARDDLGAAREALARLSATPRPGNLADLALLRSFQAAVAQRAGALAEAVRHGAEAKALGERVGYPSPHAFADVILARACARRGDGEGADRAIASVRGKLAAIGAPTLEHVLALVEAERALGAGRDDAARPALARAAATAQAGAMHARYLYSRQELGALWAAALRRGVAAEAVRAHVRAGALPPPPDAGVEWPWPARVRALGRLAVEREGVAAGAGPRAPRKPLELLAALVALGGREVDEAAVADALWPDAEADAGQHALETTLYRLRRLVGPDVVVQRSRRLSLARERCWVDVLELEAWLAPAGPGGDGGPGPGGAARAEAIVALYRGPLLAEVPARWAEEARQRLRGRLARWLDAAEEDPGARAAAARARARLAAVDPALAAAGRPRTG